MKKICVIAMAHSGHHAIINWILNQIEGKYLFINNLRNEPNNEPVNNIVRSVFKTKKPDNINLKTNSNNKSFNYLIYNIEDTKISNYKEIHSNLIKDWEPETTLLCLRDPYNNFASRIEWNKNNSKSMPIKNGIDKWKDHAKYYLSHPDNSINYNNWFQNKEYRHEIAKRLNLKFTDKGINQVGNWGFGSSFDSTKFNAKASEMSVLTRYKKFLYDPAYLNIFDEETKALAFDIFGMSLPSIRML